MKIKILYFMKLVEVAGLLAWMGQRGENYRTALADGRNLQVTINKKFVDNESAIKAGDEIALFPQAR